CNVSGCTIGTVTCTASSSSTGCGSRPCAASGSASVAASPARSVVRKVIVMDSSMLCLQVIRGRPLILPGSRGAIKRCACLPAAARPSVDCPPRPNVYSSAKESDQPFLPYAVALAAVGLFSLMDALMKGAAIAVGAYSALLLRSVIGLVLIGPVYLALRQGWPAKATMRIHVIRGVVASAMRSE